MFQSYSLLTAIIALTGMAAAQTPVTIIFDDSRNPAPYENLFYAANFNPQTQQYDQGWADYVRRPMYDDGQHGDGQAGDNVWGIKVMIQPKPGQLFEWAYDNDSDPGNGWLGTGPPFNVQSSEPVIVRAASFPGQEIQSAEALQREHGITVTKAEKPFRLSGTNKILFTYDNQAAEQVFLAGSFNDWAKNDAGVVTDFDTRMISAGNGLWFRLETINEPQVAYKYAARIDGSYVWEPDPNTPQRDSDNNSLIAPATLEERSGKSAEARSSLSSQGVEWEPYSEAARQRILSQENRALVYIRMADSRICRKFEQTRLLSDEAEELLAGKTILFLDASKTEHSETLSRLNVYRIPSLVWDTPAGASRSYTHEEGNNLNQLLAFLRQ